MPGLPWRTIAAWAIVGTVLAVGITLLDVARHRDSIGGLIHTGPDGPAAETLRIDFPNDPQFSNGEHDGPMFYAIARAPMHLDEVAGSLDRPRYRLQHPLLSWLGWLGHPTGGGDGLLWSLFAVGVLALAFGGLSMGALSVTLGGPAWMAVLFPVLPGSIMSLRLTVADTLAVALSLAAVTLFLRGRVWSAAAFGCLAVLAKEPALLPLAGVALWARDRKAIPIVVFPAVVAGAWALWLRLTFTSSGTEISEFVIPFTGWYAAFQIWIDGNSSLAIIAVMATLVLVLVALIRTRRTHPLYLAVVFSLVFLAFLNGDVVGLDRNGTRMTLPLLVFAVLALATPNAAEVLKGDRADAIGELASARA